ncbi:MAG: hypothetical protein LC627_04520, partial [Verrucomicrobiaceae bacterium]|nr:hypothetical protein [Verrucomicrobiaceae bacterium]
RRKATREEQAKLCRELIEAGVFELTSESWNEKSPFSSRLDIRINRREARYSFNSPVLSKRRKAVHRVMLRFAQRMHIDQPSSKKEATTMSEGDFQPPRKVSLADVIAKPATFHGKRISVVGYYHWEFEGSSLSVNELASRSHDFRNSIWRDEVSTFSRDAAVHYKRNGWMAVDGIFLRGPGGHLGLWPGEIVRLTRIEPLPKGPSHKTP